MSNDMLLENELFAIIRNNTIKALKHFDIEGFDVRRFAQANFNHGDLLVLLNHIATSREGWQSWKYITSEQNELNRVDRWVETHTYQISVLKRMRNDDTESTVTAEDVATRLIGWFNGIGIHQFLKDRLQTFLIDMDSLVVYNDDSDLYQRRAVFELKVIVNKKFLANCDDVKVLGVKTKPI